MGNAARSGRTYIYKYKLTVGDLPVRYGVIDQEIASRSVSCFIPSVLRAANVLLVWSKEASIEFMAQVVEEKTRVSAFRPAGLMSLLRAKPPDLMA